METKRIKKNVGGRYSSKLTGKERGQIFAPCLDRKNIKKSERKEGGNEGTIKPEENVGVVTKIKIISSATWKLHIPNAPK